MVKMDMMTMVVVTANTDASRRTIKNVELILLVPRNDDK